MYCVRVSLWTVKINNIKEKGVVGNLCMSLAPVDGDPDPDPALFFRDFQDVDKK
jgi:hypothetical protein